jgi:hypothetical protein
MPRRPSRPDSRRNTGLIVLSVLVIGSLTLSAVISLVGPTEVVPTPTPEIFVTILPFDAPTPTPDLTATPTSPGPEPPPVAPSP